MTATEPSVREAAARAWSLIADHRAGRLPDEPGLPLGIALDIVMDSGCERWGAVNSLRTAARESLHATGDRLPGRLYANPDQWAVAGRQALHYLGATPLSAEFAADQLARAESYRSLVVGLQMRRHGLTEQQWRDRADWLAWAADVRLAILWLSELLAECAA